MLQRWAWHQCPLRRSCNEVQALGRADCWHAVKHSKETIVDHVLSESLAHSGSDPPGPTGGRVSCA